MPFENPAPGWPGIPARWTSSAKSGVGTALTARSRVWFTLSHGILNEVYYPRIDHACLRDFGFIVTDGQGFFSEEKRDTVSTIRPLADGVPGFLISSTCRRNRYRLEKLVLADPHRDVVLQQVQFHALSGGIADYRLYALLAPHLVNRGADNTGWVDSYKGVPMLFAEGSGTFLAVACSAPFLGRSAGFVGSSDGWQDLARHGALLSEYDHARNGNVALVGEIDLGFDAGKAVLALGFGQNSAEAALQARSSLAEDFTAIVRDFREGWLTWQDSLLPLDFVGPERQQKQNPYRVSTAVLQTHEANSFAGGYIASLSIPWGFNKGDEDLGGYHLVWPRDLVLTAGGLLAVGAATDARRILRYLQAIQEADGRWPQNCWLDGTPYWSGVQLDECAFPILLTDMTLRNEALGESELQRLWPMVRGAAGFIMRNGPVTDQDRWEEDGGYSAFTLAVEIAALLAAADLAEKCDLHGPAAYLRETADIWNDLIERWIYVSDTPLAREVGVDGYYVRIAPPDAGDDGISLGEWVPIKNRAADASCQPAWATVSPDALALVRFGLRDANDPKIVNTVRVIDALLKTELPTGPCWRRYNGDGYGEHEDGGPFDGTGIGRLWPLLTGERAHYELAAGNRPAAEALLVAFESFASDGNLLPEQVWDAADIPERELFAGRPSGSAMPLVWAHAEHVKLLRSLADGHVFDMPVQTRQRYQLDSSPASFCAWRFNHKSRSMRAGLCLRIELLAPASIHWSPDGWRTLRDAPTRDSGFGVHVADLDTRRLPAGRSVVFTIRWLEADRWEGTDYAVAVT